MPKFIEIICVLPIELVDIVAFVSNVVDGSIVLADADTDDYVGVNRYSKKEQNLQLM